MSKSITASITMCGTLPQMLTPTC